jgi:PTH1 family peptidyl-tRNA hydrolase
VYLIAGLGNPGISYKHTRHNIGFQAVISLGRKLGVRFTGRRFHSRNALVRVNGKEVILLRPMTFMNLSGESVRACVEYYGIEAKNILIIHDDLDLPVGRIKVVSYGGTGGHRGVQSVSDYLEHRRFSRVKIGIGRPRHGETTEDYVLSPFYRDQKQIIKKIMEISVQACLTFVNEGIESAMNRVNSKNLELKEGEI